MDKSKSEKGLFIALVAVYFLSCLFFQLVIYKDDFWFNDDFRNISYYIHRTDNPGLFPDDILADVSSKFAPAGWKMLYRGAGVFFDGLFFSKLLSHMLFFFSVLLVFFIGKSCKDVFAGALAALFFLNDPFHLNRMAGGLPRAFFIPLLLLLILFWIRKNTPGVLLALFLCAFFYPLSFLFSVFFIALSFLFQKDTRKNTVLLFAGIAVCVILLFIFSESPGKMISFSKASSMSEFYKGGRIPILPLKNFFLEPLAYFLSPFTQLPGMGSYEFSSLVSRPVFLTLIISLVILLPAIFFIRQDGRLLQWLLPFVLSSLVLYLLARIFFFRLYYPYRYLYPLSLASIFIAGAGLSALGERLLKKKAIFLLFVVSIYFLSTGFRIIPYNGFMHFRPGEYRDLLGAVSKFPEKAVMGGNAYILDSVPLFCKRTVFVSDELTIPFLTDLYPEIKKRHIVNAKAYYAETKEELLDNCKLGAIDYLVIFKPDLVPLYAEAGIFYQSEPIKSDIITMIKDRKSFFLSDVSGESVIFSSDNLQVIDVERLKRGE